MGDRQVEIGLITPAIVVGFEKAFWEAVKKQEHHKELYYMLFHADWYADGSQLKLVFSPRDKKPPMMLNTICWLIDNMAGSIKELWGLPKDAPIGPVEMSGEIIRSVAEEGIKMPLTYAN